jgi:hypothetical protein
MLTEILQAIASFEMADAIEALDNLYLEHHVDHIKKAATNLNKDDRRLLGARVRARKVKVEKEAEEAYERLAAESWGEFKVGDRVRIKSEVVDIQIVKRGRIRTLSQKSGNIRRRIASVLTIVGTGKHRGSRKLFYKSGVSGQMHLCLCPSLIGVDLVVEGIIAAPYLDVRRVRSGTHAPGLLASDLVLNERSRI